jgi:hypothetical protein
MAAPDVVTAILFEGAPRQDPASQSRRSAVLKANRTRRSGRLQPPRR